MFDLKEKQLSTSRKKKSLLIIASLTALIGIGSGYEYVHSNETSTNEISNNHHLLSHMISGFNRNIDKEVASHISLEPSDSVQEDIHHKDYFKSMTQLLKHTTQGVDWKKEIKKVGSHELIIAPHGGNLEAGTTELTKYIANHHHYDYYSFTVLRKHHAEDLHVTSRHYNDPQLLNMVKSKDFAVSIHGTKGSRPIVYIGGLDTSLKDALKKQLTRHHFVVKNAPAYLGGDLKKNFINRDIKNKGVQLELTTALRKSIFVNENLSYQSRKDKSNWSPVMYRFSDAIHLAIKEVDDSGKDR